MVFILTENATSEPGCPSLLPAAGWHPRGMASSTPPGSSTCNPDCSSTGRCHPSSPAWNQGRHCWGCEHQQPTPHLSNAQTMAGSGPGLVLGEVQLPGQALGSPSLCPAPKLHPGNFLPTQTEALTENINPFPCLTYMLQVTPREVQKPTKTHLLPRY